MNSLLTFIKRQLFVVTPASVKSEAIDGWAEMSRGAVLLFRSLVRFILVITFPFVMPLLILTIVPICYIFSQKYRLQVQRTNEWADGDQEKEIVQHFSGRF
jgi:hypothetical protein